MAKCIFAPICPKLFLKNFNEWTKSTQKQLYINYSLKLTLGQSYPDPIGNFGPTFDQQKCTQGVRPAYLFVFHCEVLTRGNP